MKAHWSEQLPANACREAREWCAKQKSFAHAWKTCTRGDWMLWLLGELNNSTPWSEERKLLVHVAIECAETALQYVNNDTITAQLWCLDALRRWCDGEDNQDEVTAARDAAADAYAADAYAAVAYAAVTYANAAAVAAAATYAVAATHVAAYAAAAAAAAADAAAYVANADDAYARLKSLAESADIVRERFPHPPKLVVRQ